MNAKISFLPVLPEGETQNSYFMSLIVAFHRLTNYNYIPFPHVPCLWAQPKIPVKSPCGLFPRTFPVRSLSWEHNPGFYSLSHYWSAHSQSLYHHCVIAKPSGLQEWPSSHDGRVLWGQFHLETKHCLSPLLYIDKNCSGLAKKNYIFY